MSDLRAKRLPGRFFTGIKVEWNRPWGEGLQRTLGDVWNARVLQFRYFVLNFIERLKLNHLVSVSDNELIELIAIGDTNSFRELYNRYWFALYNKAYSKIGRKDVAEELAQQVFQVLWEKRARLVIERVAPYLFGALRNLVIDYYRREEVEENYMRFYCPTAPESSFINPQNELQLSELQDAINRGLQQLSPKTQQVFVLSRVEYLTIPEIASRIGQSEKVVEYHLSKALNFFRKHLKEFIGLILIISSES